jgi:hypothetical protein
MNPRFFFDPRFIKRKIRHKWYFPVRKHDYFWSNGLMNRQNTKWLQWPAHSRSIVNNAQSAVAQVINAVNQMKAALASIEGSGVNISSSMSSSSTMSFAGMYDISDGSCDVEWSRWNCKSHHC